MSQLTVADPVDAQRKIHLLDTGGHVYDVAWAPQPDVEYGMSRRFSPQMNG